jgi:hypothetical protein
MERSSFSPAKKREKRFGVKKDKKRKKIGEKKDKKGTGQATLRYNLSSLDIISFLIFLSKGKRLSGKNTFLFYKGKEIALF